jgi:hypothetical protein
MGEIGSLQGVTEAAVRQRVHRAERALQQHDCDGSKNTARILLKLPTSRTMTRGTVSGN